MTGLHHRPAIPGWANPYRTAALDPDVCSTEYNLALKYVSGPVEAHPPF